MQPYVGTIQKHLVAVGAVVQNNRAAAALADDKLVQVAVPVTASRPSGRDLVDEEDALRHEG